MNEPNPLLILRNSSLLRQQQAEIEVLKKYIQEKYDQRCETVATMLRQQQAEIEVLKAKTLTDEEIIEVWRENERVYPLDRSRLLDRTRACIKKAQEK